MRVDELLDAGLTRSFEFFPPKNDEEAAVLAATLADLEGLSPSFVSVTYRGGAESRQRTFDLVTSIQRAGRLTPMAHVVCVGHTRAEMREVLARYRDAGVENLMALRGDAPVEGPAAGEFAHAIDLVELAREVGSFSIGVAAHPQGHPESPGFEADRHRLAEKLAAADFAVTQFFFRAEEWAALVEDLAARGVHKPVVPGVMPVTTLGGVERMAAMGGRVPAEVVARLVEADARGGPAAVRAEGVVAATQLCRELLDAGAPGLHFYTLNRSTATREIHRALFGV
ncbi:MAG: methylenetetrahydrofolate reductase [Acidobacteriota bacterium]|nr:methylenetetrahydrofolate reductase [Acidobacteriota bacterium]